MINYYIILSSERNFHLALLAIMFHSYREMLKGNKERIQIVNIWLLARFAAGTISKLIIEHQLLFGIIYNTPVYINSAMEEISQ